MSLTGGERDGSSRKWPKLARLLKGLVGVTRREREEVICEIIREKIDRIKLKIELV